MDGLQLTCHQPHARVRTDPEPVPPLEDRAHDVLLEKSREPARQRRVLDRPLVREASGWRHDPRADKDRDCDWDLLAVYQIVQRDLVVREGVGRSGLRREVTVQRNLQGNNRARRSAGPLPLDLVPVAFPQASHVGDG